MEWKDGGGMEVRRERGGGREEVAASSLKHIVNERNQPDNLIYSVGGGG